MIFLGVATSAKVYIHRSDRHGPLRGRAVPPASPARTNAPARLPSFFFPRVVRTHDGGRDCYILCFPRTHARGGFLSVGFRVIPCFPCVVLSVVLAFLPACRASFLASCLPASPASFPAVVVLPSLSASFPSSPACRLACLPDSRRLASHASLPADSLPAYPAAA